MKNIVRSIAVLVILIIAVQNANSEVKYKGFLSAGGAVMNGDTYEYVMGVDGKIGLSIKTEHGICFNPNDFRNTGIFFGGGIGFDYVNVSLSEFNQEEYETNDILSNTVMAVPIYLTLKYIYNIKHISMVYALRGGYYKWFRGHIIENEKQINKNYDIPYKGNYMLGFAVGVRFPFSTNYGVSLMFDFDYMGANIKWQGENISNNKIGASIAFDF